MTQDAGAVRERTPMTFFFDLLALDDEQLLDLPAAERADRLAALVPETARVGRLVTDDPAGLRPSAQAVLASGHGAW